MILLIRKQYAILARTDMLLSIKRLALTVETLRSQIQKFVMALIVKQDAMLAKITIPQTLQKFVSFAEMVTLPIQNFVTHKMILTA